MGLFDVFGKKKATATQKAVGSPVKDINKIIRESDKAIAEMHKADAAFEQDGNIEKRIKIYDSAAGSGGLLVETYKAIEMR